MTTLNIGGKRVTVGDEFMSLTPDQQQATVDEIAKSLNLGGNTNLSRGQKAADMGLSAAQGFQTGFQSLLGSLGDAQQATGDLAAWGAGKLGFSPETQQTARNIGMRVPTMGLALPAPTTEQVNSAFESVIGPKYQPQTKAGETFQTIGEFVPGAMAGPGGPLRKAAMAVVPGVAVEATDELTGGNPYAKAAAGIAAGVLTAGRGNTGTRQAIRNAPTAEAIAQQTDNTYQALRQAGIAYDNNSFGNFVQDLQRQMRARGYRPRANDPHPITADLAELAAAANNPLDFSEMESLRQSIGRNLAANASNQDRAAANFVRERLDDFMENAPLITNGSVPADQVHALTRQARELASRNIKNRILEEAIANARTTASGFENGLRIEFRKIVRNPNRLRGFSRAERNAMLQIIGGTTPQNLMAQFGRLGISLDRLTSKASLLPTLIAGGGYTSGTMLPAAGVVGAATAAKYGSRLMAERSARDLTALARVGRAGQDQAATLDDVARAQARARAALTASTSARLNGPDWFLQDANGNVYGPSGARVPR